MQSFHTLQVGIPSSFRLIVGVADIMARLGALSTYLANFGHWFFPPIRVGPTDLYCEKHN
jgi:hypothetical protein